MFWFNVGLFTLMYIDSFMQNNPTLNQTRPDEELRELESLSLTIKSMFCERENVPVINNFALFQHLRHT